MKRLVYTLKRPAVTFYFKQLNLRLLKVWIHPSILNYRELNLIPCPEQKHIQREDENYVIFDNVSMN